jgi:hypothetical protein
VNLLARLVATGAPGLLVKHFRAETAEGTPFQREKGRFWCYLWLLRALVKHLTHLDKQKGVVVKHRLEGEAQNGDPVRV